MVKKYAELYLDARRALLPTEGQFASNVARELICAASGKTAEQLISTATSTPLRRSVELAQSFCAPPRAGEPMPYILGEWGLLRHDAHRHARRAHSPRRSPYR